MKKLIYDEFIFIWEVHVYIIYVYVTLSVTPT